MITAVIALWFADHIHISLRIVIIPFHPFQLAFVRYLGVTKYLQS